MSKINFQDMLEFSLYTCADRLQEVITVIEDNLEDQELVAKQIEEMTGKSPEETEEDIFEGQELTDENKECKVS